MFLGTFTVSTNGIEPTPSLDLLSMRTTHAHAHEAKFSKNEL